MPTYLKNFSPILYDAPAPRTQNDIEIIDATITRSTGDGRIKTITFGIGDAGATADRFAVGGEDDIATADRLFNLDGNNMTINGVEALAVNSGTYTATLGALNVSEFNISIVNSDADLQSTSVVQTNNDGTTTVRSSFLLADNRMDVQEPGIKFTQIEKDGLGNFATDKTNYFLLPNTAAEGQYITKTIAATRVGDDFANDAAAAAGGIGIGKYYHTSGVVKMRLA